LTIRLEQMQNSFIIEGPKKDALVQLTSWRDISHSGLDSYRAQHDIVEHVRWGVGDNHPNFMRSLMVENNQIQAELETLRDMIYGSGGRFYKKMPDGTAVPFYDERLSDWAEATDLDNYEISAINQRLELGNHFTRFEYDLKQKVPFISIVDGFNVRVKRPKTLKSGIEGYIINPYFGEWAYYNPKDNETIPVFNPATLDTDLVQILHSKVPIAGNPYYSFPSWWGAKEWIELANLIPIFHKNGIKNGYNIKYIIKMPADYFDGVGAGKENAKQLITQKWAEWEDNMRRMLSGEENVNKALVIKYMRGDGGSALDSIDVTSIDNKMSDDAYAKILEMSMQNIANAIGLIATLGGVNPGKGNDSGSQIRVMADYQQHFRTTIPRTITATPINKCLRMMGYKDVYRWYDGVQITTLDNNKAGIQEATNFPVNQ
jgi:hypothetical protein